MASRGDMIKRGRARVNARRAARNREESMARQGATRFKRENIDTDQKRGFFGDLAQMGRDVTGFDKVRDTGPVRDISTMGRDLIVDPIKKGKKYLPSIYGGVQRGLDSLTGAWNEAQEARRDDKKWTLGGDPLDVTRGSDAYRYLLTQIDDPEDRKAFRREVGKDNLHWTELNEYAGENAAGLAKKINEYNAGIRSFPKGEDIYSNFVRQGSDLEGTGMIGDAAARIARAQKEGRAGFFEPWMNEEFESVTPPFDDTVTQVFPASTDPDEIFYPSRPDVLSRQEGLDTSPEIQEFMMKLYTDPEVGDPRYRVEPSPPPLIEDIADSASLAEEIAARDRRLNAIGPFEPTPPRTMQWPNTLPPGFVPGRPYDDFPMVNAPVYPEDKEEWINYYFGPYGPEQTEEELEELYNYSLGRGLWGPQYYPDQFGPVDI
mgnify:CR=1 FL=1